jgi:predicted Zn-dependent protease with MMP-like domain
MEFETLNEQEWERVEKAWNLLEEGDTERARAEVEAVKKARGPHPDLWIVEAALCLEDDRPDLALEALKGAERAADPSQFFHLRALAHFDLVQLELARDDSERALAITPDYAEAHDLMARVLEHLGDDERAAEHAELAQELDSEAFPGPLEVSDEEFDAMVEQSIRELPDRVRQEIKEVPILVQPLPPRELLAAEHPPMAPDLLGLFVGRGLTDRAIDDLPGVPGAIYLFRRNLLRACADREELAKEIRITVQHEVGHLLGLDEDDLEEWGLA